MNQLDKLAAAIDRHAVGESGKDTAVPGLLLARRTAPSEFHSVVYESSLCIVAQGAKEVRLAGETFRYDPAQLLVVAVDLPLTARVLVASKERPCLAVRISLDPLLLGDLLADRNTPLRSAPPSRALATPPLESPLLDAVTRFVELLDAPSDIPVLSPLVLREIAYRVLTGPQGGRLRQITAAGAPAQRVARAVQWLSTHFVEPLRVDALAKLAGMSSSGLHLHFKNVTSMSPLQYQKRLRLQEAKRLMVGEHLDAAEAAYKVGYESPSQFGREYRRLPAF